MAECNCFLTYAAVNRKLLRVVKKHDEKWNKMNVKAEQQPRIYSSIYHFWSSCLSCFCATRLKLQISTPPPPLLYYVYFSKNRSQFVCMQKDNPAERAFLLAHWLIVYISLKCFLDQLLNFWNTLCRTGNTHTKLQLAGWDFFGKSPREIYL